jgi:hypothetical protein
MKNIFHFLVILAVTCAFAGGIYLIANSSGSTGGAFPQGDFNNRQGFGNRGVPGSDQNSAPAGTESGGASGSSLQNRPQGFGLGGGEDREGREGSSQIGGWIGVIQNLAVIGSVTLVVVILRKLFTRKEKLADNLPVE